MPLVAGDKLGPYEIVAPLGAGGMGEVYRARDTRLDRIVAIKILPGQLTDNAHSRERFEREARALASINHPDICAIYDVGHQDGIEYLVMEYVEVVYHLATLALKLGEAVGLNPIADRKQAQRP
jgi:eukaryotic-like serine/threonine-protein kinase